MPKKRRLTRTRASVKATRERLLADARAVRIDVAKEAAEIQSLIEVSDELAEKAALEEADRRMRQQNELLEAARRAVMVQWFMWAARPIVNSVGDSNMTVPLPAKVYRAVLSVLEQAGYHG